MRARALLCAALCLGSAYARDDDDDDESAEAQSYKEFWKLMNMTMEEISNLLFGSDALSSTAAALERTDGLID